jgi:hypothetical protein
MKGNEINQLKKRPILIMPGYSVVGEMLSAQFLAFRALME